MEGLQGILPRQNSAAFGGAGHRRRGRAGDLQGFLPGQGVGSTALRGAELRSVAPFSDVDAAPGRTRAVLADTRLRVHATVTYGGFRNNFMQYST